MSDTFFSVLPVGSTPSATDHSKAFILTDNWNDWYEFRTLYELVVIDAAGVQHDIGGVKIGQFGMLPGQDRPALPEEFDELDDRFFSVGQDPSYYEGLYALDADLRDRVFSGLQDVVMDLELFDRALTERVTGLSLLRSVSEVSVRGQFRRLALGGARLSPYKFSYTAGADPRSMIPPITVSFHVEPESEPPTNVHVLIGRNGVGKTRLLHNMTRAIVEVRPTREDVGQFESVTDLVRNTLFANLVSVSFSAFDRFEPLRSEVERGGSVRYAYIGLKLMPQTAKDTGALKSPASLTAEFVQSARFCNHGPRASRWLRALKMLESDPIFQDAAIAALPRDWEGGGVSESATQLFENLSSGHQIVLLTITRLIEAVEERTLVVLDEPEAHLHPPLLSAFVRSLSDLLINLNGVAIVATHSPVVLQEVPSQCAWKMRRTGRCVVVERPEIETFGENVGVLTREVFGLEVTHSGFHRMLLERVKVGDAFEEIVDRFRGQLGGEARALVRALVAARDSGSAA